MRNLALALVLLAASPAHAQLSISGGVSLGGAFSGAIGVAAPEVNECDLPLSFASNQGANCMRTIYHLTGTTATTWDRRVDISYGADLGQQKLTTDCNTQGCGNITAPGWHSAVRMQGASPPNTAWIAAYDPASGTETFGDGETCVEVMDTEVSGEQCGGAAALITEGSNQGTVGACGSGDGGAYMYTACEAKGTDTGRLDRVNLCTGAMTALDADATSPVNAIDIYGGSSPPANCNHEHGQADWHQNCQWIQVCLRVQQSGGDVTLTGRMWRIGKAAGWAKGDPENNDPGPPSGTTTHTRTLIGTSTFTGARHSSINTTGRIGVAGRATQQTQTTSVTNLRFSETPQP